MKFLVLRFSSFGDVVETLSVPSKLKELDPTAEIHWITKAQFAPLIEGHPNVSRIWALQKNTSLWNLIWKLQKEQFTHIYDAHNSFRSQVICFFLRALNPKIEFTKKSQKRWKRFLLFRFRINKFRQPFSGQRDLLEPLKKWNLNETLPPAPQIALQDSSLQKVKALLAAKNFSSFVALAPSAAYVLKRWPVEHFKKLVAINPHLKFVCMGGPDDLFIQDIVDVAPERVLNLAGQTSFPETTALVHFSTALISNDTGILHIGEQLGKKTMALMGPAPFGFPSRESTKILELKLECRPCSKHGQGPCVNAKFHKCLVDITPEQVSLTLKEITLA